MSDRRTRNHIDDVELVLQRRNLRSHDWGFNGWWRRESGEFQLDYEQGVGTRRPLGDDVALEPPPLARTARAQIGWQRGWGSWRHELRLSWAGVRDPASGADFPVIGSRWTVRGFDARDLLAAREQVSLKQDWCGPGIEWRAGWAVQPYAALDIGRVAGGAPGGRTLAGAAAGLRGQVGGKLGGGWPSTLPWPRRCSTRAAFRRPRRCCMPASMQVTESQGETMKQTSTKTRIAQAILLLGGLHALAPAGLPQAWAQATAEANAPAGRKPKIDTAGNGTTVVHIAPANSSGVSHNLFTQLNVNAAGLVLNNSTAAPGSFAPPPPPAPTPAPTPTPRPPPEPRPCARCQIPVMAPKPDAKFATATTATSQLAGAIGGNVLFAGNPAAQARLIVNEVTSTAASTLAGGIEVFGMPADVVIANPNGITCNGCGFINTHRASLVSGRPLVGSTLDGFSVSGGTVAIGAGGLNGSSLSSLDLIGGAVQVDGPVNLPAGNSAIYAVAGPNQVSYTTLAATPQGRSDAQPAVSIDIGAAAGMLANQIYLLANEAGPGVNIRGRLEASAGGLTLDAAGNLGFTGTLKTTAGGAAVVSAQGVSAAGASVDSTGLALVQSAAAVNWTGGTVNGSDVMLASAGAMDTDALTLQATGDIRLNSGGELTYKAGSLKAGASVAMTAAADLTLSPTSSSSRVYEGNTTRDLTRYTRTTLDAGGSVALQSTGGIVTLDGTQVQAGGSIAVQGNGVALLARKDLTKEVTVNGNTTLMPTTENLVQARLVAGGDVALLASGTGAEQGKLFITGAKIESNNGHVSLVAARDLDVAHDITTDTTYERFYEVKRKWFSKRVTDITKTSLEETANPSDISGRSVSLGAGGNLNIVGSLVMADGAVGLHADQDLNLLATQEASYAYESRAVKKSGIFGNGGLSITIGSKSRSDITSTQETRQASTSVGSLAGDVLATAGGSYLQLSSDITAPIGDIHIAAQNITLQSNNNTRSVLNIVRERQSGLTLAATSPLVSAVQTVGEMNRVAKRTENGRHQAMALLTSGLTIYNNYTSFENLLKADTLSGAATAGGWSFSASIGASASDFESLSKTSTPIESAINAGRNASLTATGTGDNGDINLIGSRVTASQNLSVRADRDLTLTAAVGRDSEQTRRTSSSASVGISFGIGGPSQGFSVNLAASRSNAWSNGWGTTFFNSELTAGGELSMFSGRDTSLSGAKATGERAQVYVGHRVGGNLSLVSPQDETFYQAKEQSWGINVSIPIPGGSIGAPSLGLSASQLRLLAEYESIKQQSAIVAGTRGLDVQVWGHTHLSGAAVASKADASKNYFETQTLTHEDVANRDVVSGKSWSVSLSTSVTPAGGGTAGSAMGFARLDTQETFTTRSSIAGGVHLTRADLQPARVATMKAAQREPLAAQRSQKQSELEQLLWSEPPPCDDCYYNVQGAPSPSVDSVRPGVLGVPGKAEAATTTASLPAPVEVGVGAGTDYYGNNSRWQEWNQAVQALRGEIAALDSRINAVDARVYQDRTSLSTSPSGLHQPLLHTFDKTKATQELRDGVAVTAAFGKAAYKAAGDYAGAKYKEAFDACPDKKDCAEADKWKDGGLYRSALHTAIGGIAFGTPGATGNIAGSLALNAMDKVVTSLGITDPTAINTLKNLAVTVAGAGVGGTAGAAAAFNADANNRQLHPDERALAQTLAARSGGRFTAAQIEDAMRALGNRALGEDISAGMRVNIPNWEKEIFDPNAAWTVGADGQKLVQVLRSVSPEATKFLQEQTGGLSSVYMPRMFALPPEAASPGQPRDTRTGLPLDAQGRYTINYVLDGKQYSAKYWPCATADCVAGAHNIDRSDAASKLYLAAADAQIFKDMNKAANIGILVSPTGVVGGVAASIGTVANIGAAITDSDLKTEVAKMAAQNVSASVIVSLLGHSAGNAARFNAFVDLQGGWDAFVKPLIKDFSSPAPKWPAPLPYSPPKNGPRGQ
ncbi:hemagglutinin repeat-containing protein [Roseateles sp. LKC17W]|uniref:Hemagglutinin repeat-containing protein n=1 Tax=Pelomonas margarita TaxID=3299031 RepID=A0ABW7FF30_9BURK